MNPGSENDSLLFGLDLRDEALRQELKRSAIWGKRMATVCLVMYLLVILSTIYYFLRFGAYSGAISRSYRLEVTIHSIVVVIAHIGAIISAIYIRKYSAGINAALKSDRQDLLVASFQALRKNFVIVFFMTFQGIFITALPLIKLSDIFK